MRVWLAAPFVFGLAACGTAARVDQADGSKHPEQPEHPAQPDAGDPDAGASTGETDAGPGDVDEDAGTDPHVTDGGVDVGTSDTATWRTSLRTCWTDATCPRALAVAHGGEWDTAAAPYDSNAALTAAFDRGLDGVKIDVRVTSDNVPVISHSSPLEIFESLDCYNRRIEDMTAAEVTACHRLPSHTETFQRLDDVLQWLRGKMVVQLCVKRADDYQRTIDEVHAQGAEDFAFLEISPQEMVGTVPTLVGADDIYFLINAASDVSSVDSVLALQDPRAFMIEFDPTVALGDLVTARLHPVGVRSFTYDDAKLVTTADLKAHFEAGYDVVSTNAAAKVTDARIEVNTARGLTDP